MKTIIFFSLFFLLIVPFVWAGNPDHVTLTLRFQPPAETVASADNCVIHEEDVNTAVKALTKQLRKDGVDVQLGRFSTAEGSGKLWICGKPIETWLKIEKPCEVTAAQIVTAALAALDNMKTNPKLQTKSAARSAKAVMN